MKAGDNMLKFEIRGENIELTQALIDYAEKRFAKLNQYFKTQHDAIGHINLKAYTDSHDGYKTHKFKVEFTTFLDSVTFRAEDSSKDMYGSIDNTVEKIERQIHKHKTKLNRKSRKA